MTLSLSKEVKERLDLVSPAIVFFALPASQQIDVLPTLEKKQKYDFSQGDLLTGNPLEVLLAAYEDCLNGLLNWLMVMTDESRSQDAEIVNSLIEELLNTVHTIVDKHSEEVVHVDNLQSPEWSKLRQLSHVVQQHLQIQLEANTAAISQFIAYWLHT
ncbi:hypothetical protein H6F86_12770 [Phormidium sp. FACHB-592]|uniref:Uncharacterized protein n=1 Tax=Stenomitos frigidus AS-A4 TaxID=2933935 RepID=A0ABV0KJM4_9CYAN|nr:hypothetical protein [Phormidium sp. FACHB-592]MBD2074746.1 hypothetical protein [Phormidium sp. FACHB-592]